MKLSFCNITYNEEELAQTISYMGGEPVAIAKGLRFSKKGFKRTDLGSDRDCAVVPKGMKTSIPLASFFPNGTGPWETMQPEDGSVLQGLAEEIMKEMARELQKSMSGVLDDDDVVGATSTPEKMLKQRELLQKARDSVAKKRARLEVELEMF